MNKGAGVGAAVDVPGADEDFEALSARELGVAFEYILKDGLGKKVKTRWKVLPCRRWCCWVEGEGVELYLSVCK